MRFFGLVATGVLLGVGIAITLTVMPDSNSPTVALSETAPPAQPKTVTHKKKAAKPKLTTAQRHARTAAVGTLRDQGYRPVTLKDYAPNHVLRVLIGKGDGGLRAFFFAGGKYIGNDATDDSGTIKVVRAGNRSVSLSYKLFKPGDKACCPSGGTTRVLFRWDGKNLAPQTAIPPATARHAPA